MKTLKIYGTVFWEGINTHRKGSTVARASNWVGLDQVKINVSGSQQLKVQVNNDELIHGPSHVCLKIVVLECLISEVTLLCNTIWLGKCQLQSSKGSRVGGLANVTAPRSKRFKSWWLGKCDSSMYQRFKSWSTSDNANRNVLVG